MDWEKIWKEEISRSTKDMFPRGEAPLTLLYADHLLVKLMAEYGFRTVLCAGNGISQEPHALAEAGFDVTALDLSPTATSVAEAYVIDEWDFLSFCPAEARRPGGHADFIVGDLFDKTVCPGPFDVVIERRTVQRIPECKRGAALEALAERLAPVGIFLSECNDDQFPMEFGYAFHEHGYYHASESWFRERAWTLWDGLPNCELSGQVAWLIRSGTMKPSPWSRLRNE